MSSTTPIDCVIVDNNEIDLYLTEHLVELNKSLHLLASFSDAYEALHFLQAHPEVKLILLDIEMPGLSGLELMRQLAHPHPHVIIISTHRDFALEAFDLHVADYLLKPVVHTRFQEAVELLQLRCKVAAAPNLLPAGPGSSLPAARPATPPHELAWKLDKDSHDLFVKVNNRLLRLNFDDVLYIEAMSTYSVLVTARQKLIVHFTLKSIVERLPFAHFRRVHRSYVVNTKLIDSIEDNVLTLAGHEVPLAKSYQDELLHSLRSL
jgi:DNA-binding LytR/AlgR family response regulator